MCCDSRKRRIIIGAEARFYDQLLNDLFKLEIKPEFCGILILIYLKPKGIEELKDGFETIDAKSVFQLPVRYKIGEIEVEVKDDLTSDNLSNLMLKLVEIDEENEVISSNLEDFSSDHDYLLDEYPQYRNEPQVIDDEKLENDVHYLMPVVFTLVSLGIIVVISIAIKKYSKQD